MLHAHDTVESGRQQRAHQVSPRLLFKDRPVKAIQEKLPHPSYGGVETQPRRERCRTIALVPTRIHFIGGDLAIDVTQSLDELQRLLAVTGPRDGPSSLTNERESRTHVRRGDRLLARSPQQEAPGL